MVNNYKKNKNNIIICKNECYMLIFRQNLNYKVLIDEEDIEKIEKYKWHIHLRKRDGRVDVCTNTYGSHKERKYLLLTRYLLNPSKDLKIDHINRNTLDNRKENLRIVTTFENNLNKSNNTSGCVGVVWDKSRNQWKVDLRNKFIGRFDNFEDAVKARKYAERNLK